MSKRAYATIGIHVDQDNKIEITKLNAGTVNLDIGGYSVFVPLTRLAELANTICEARSKFLPAREPEPIITEGSIA